MAGVESRIGGSTDQPMPTEQDLFQASPFAEDYPLSREQVQAQQVCAPAATLARRPARELNRARARLTSCARASKPSPRLPRARDVPVRPWQDVGIWSSDMDHQLSLFVRKYCFDFAKASKALRSYVQHVREPPPQRAAGDIMRPARCRCACAHRAPSPGARPR